MITIVTDSTAYLTREEARQMGVKVLPISYTAGGMQFSETYIGANGNYERLIHKYGDNCKTSQANVSVFLSAFDELLRKKHKIFCITMSSRLSGTYSSASVAAKETGSSDIIVVDSLTTAGGLAKLIKYARNLFNDGKTCAEVADAMEKKRDTVRIRFSVDDMQPLRRSGRLGIVRQSVSTMLNIKPILKCEDGIVVSDNIARGQAEQINKLIYKIPQNCSEVTVHYISDLKRAVSIASILESRPQPPKVTLRKLGPVLGIHLGLGVVGVVYFVD